MPATPTVYADESNSTGENLLDPAQPIFCAAGVYVDADLARSVVDGVKAQMAAPLGEPKYTLLSKTPKGRSALLTALGSLTDQTIRAYLAHKRFMVTTKLVDMLVEQLAFETGYNMYADGAAPALANMLHYAAGVSGDGDAFDRMLHTFINAARRRSKASADELFAAMAAYQATTEGPFSDISEILLHTRSQADDTFATIASGKLLDYLDPAVPCLVELCHGLGAELGDFALVHDASKTIERQAPQLLTAHELPDPARPGQNLPRLPLTGITFSDSTTAPELQLADWVAGAVRQWATRNTTGQDDPFADALEEIVQPWVLGGIWPDLESVTNPRRLD
ncbi:DUF3800 domain-containing protein [Streptomyces hydrogenans]|uniref:DUF3800 domain-containing protein n=1 Tax=Streptomyces hydrogenans TaxID=1873719 RepID=UPI003817AB1A